MEHSGQRRPRGSGIPAGAGTTADETPGAERQASARDVVLSVAFVIGIAVAAPFLEGAGNIIGLLIISFGLWQAWKLNAATPLAIEGPFRLQQPSPPLMTPPPLPPPVPGA